MPQGTALPPIFPGHSSLRRQDCGDAPLCHHKETECAMGEMNTPKSEIPTLAEWAGDSAAFEALTKRFYEKVPNDPVLAPVFKTMGPQHAHHVADFVAEVFGGAKSYSENGGSHAGMVSRHLGRHL